jgi:tetratricopeptide (TPR) repeat protein
LALRITLALFKLLSKSLSRLQSKLLIQSLLKKRLCKSTYNIRLALLRVFLVLCRGSRMKIQETIWTHYAELGSNALKSNELVLAETMFAAAAEEAQRGIPDTSRLAHSWFGLAQTHHTQNQILLATHYYRKALSIYERSSDKFATQLAATWDNLAEIYIGQGDFSKAHSHYRKSVRIYEKLFGKNSEILAPRLLRLGYICLHFKEFDQALQYRDRAKALTNASKNNNDSSKTNPEASKANPSTSKANFQEFN